MAVGITDKTEFERVAFALGSQRAQDFQHGAVTTAGDGFAFGPAIGLVRVGDRAFGIAVERVAGVNMVVAEVGVSFGVALRFCTIGSNYYTEKYSVNYGFHWMRLY